MKNGKLVLDSESAKFTITIVTKDKKDLLKRFLQIGKNMEINVKKTSAIYNPFTKKAKITFTFNIDDLEKFINQIVEITDRRK
jgi:ACT domain-containing protein